MMLSPEVITKAINAIQKNTSNYEYFFTKISSPVWIKPLWEEGYFKKPPQVITDGKYIRFPSWVESEYLIRMASRDPEIVAEVALSIPETDNIRIHEDLVDIALNLPIHLAIKLIPKIKNWLDSQYSQTLPRPFLPEKVAQLMVKLAKEGKSELALDLMKTLLEVFKAEDNQESFSLFNLQPRTRFDKFEYGKILQEYIPDLLKMIGQPVLEILINLLSKAIEFSENPQRIERYTSQNFVWIHYLGRYDLDDDQTRSYREIENALIIAVRDAAKQLIENNPEQINSIIPLLQQQHWLIFHKIALYLLNQFPDINLNLVIDALQQREYFESCLFELNDYMRLAHQYFNLLSCKAQNDILAWIHKPCLPFLQEDDSETEKKWERKWQLTMLTIFKDNLSGEWLQKYQELENEFGSKSISDLMNRNQIEVSPVSLYGEKPKTVDELLAMSKDDLLTFLKTWQPTSPHSFNLSSFSGVELVLGEAVEQKTEYFASIAEHFTEVNPKYSRAVLRNLSFVLRNQKDKMTLNNFKWSSILNLCGWIVNSSQEIREWEEQNPDFGIESYRHAVLDILNIGLQFNNSLAISFKLREKIWNILLPLTQDNDPTSEYEQDYCETNQNNHLDNISYLMLNSLRSKAIETAIYYALWIRRHHEKLPDKDQYIEQGFNMIPEVRQVLDDHLNLDQETSLGVHAVYGNWFPQLTYLDEQWTIENLNKIFPKEEHLKAFRLAAWETYLTHCRPYTSVYKILENEYLHAVENIDMLDHSSEEITEPQRALIHHLMILYWWGEFTFEKDNILDLFYQKASDRLRGSAMEFLGRTLSDAKNDTTLETLEKLSFLWERRINEIKNSSHPENYNKELYAFAWWYHSEKFDDRWSIKQLRESLELITKMDRFYQYLALDRLTGLAQETPIEVIECLSLMTLKNSDNSCKLEKISKILKLIFQSNNEEAMSQATNLIHDLGNRNQRYWSLRELLPISVESDAETN